jgi:hypothetical protein
MNSLTSETAVEQQAPIEASDEAAMQFGNGPHFVRAGERPFA